MLRPRVRARLAHEKEERRQALLAAAAGLLEARGFLDLTMADLAREAGLGKGTTYIYFNTKEEIFLELAEVRLLGWFEALDEGLRPGAGGLFPEPMAPEALAALARGAYDSQPGLGSLLALLHTVLARNVDPDAALRFHAFLADRCLRTGRLLEHRLPFLGDGEGAALVLRIHALALGAWQVAHPPARVRALFQAPGLELLDVSFGPMFETSLQALVRGLEVSRDGGRGGPGAAGPGG
ncbi:MAG: TetR family transcriptional regulator [Holophagaceae bacterium]